MREVALAASMGAYRTLFWYPLDRAAATPDRAQRAALTRLLSRNQHTRFGVEHGFADSHDPLRFRERVPIAEYENLRPYVDEQRRTGSAALTSEPPLFYAQTSGSTGAPKLIPITRRMLELHKREQALFSYLQYRACAAAFAGRAWGIMGASIEGRLESGHTVGSVSGHLYRSLPRVVQRRFVVPPDVSAIADYELKYRVILRLALGAPDITYIGAPNSSTFLRLIDLLNEERDEFARSVATGVFEPLDALEGDLRELVARRIAASPAMARRLTKPGELSFADVWPDIRLVTTWTGGTCGLALERLRSKLPAAAAVMELGYQSTEFRGSLALTTETPAGLPPLHHHFFEFVEQGAWDSGRHAVQLLEELLPGRTYYVIVTTASGLYRYFMNDLVQVTGMYRRTPLIRFVQKGKGVTSLTGEKLYEAQVVESVRTSWSAGAGPAFFMMIADEEVFAYRLFVELTDGDRPDAAVFAARVDQRLGELNIEYHSKRASGRLHPLRVAWVRRGTGEAFKLACISAGQREGQFKPAVLQYRKDVRFAFDEHAVS